MLGLLPLSGDEAYYWLCARHFDWSYFDQPPLVLWMMGLSTALFGINETAARLPAVMLGILFTLAVPRVARAAGWDERTGFFALVALAATPLVALGTMYVSTDLALSLFALVVPVLAALAIERDRPALWLLVGFLVGLAGLSKFPAILLAPVVLLLLVLHPTGRRHFRRPELWLGLLVALLVASPVFVWGAENDWANFRFQLVDRHRRGVDGLSGFGRLWIPQLLLVTPGLLFLFLGGLVVEGRRGWRERKLVPIALAASAVVFLAFFSLSSFRSSGAPHWLAPAWAPAALLASRWIFGSPAGGRTRLRKAATASFGFAFLLSAGVHLALPFVERLPAEVTLFPGARPIATTRVGSVLGWRELVGRLRRLEGSAFDPATDPIVCESYTDASMIAFYSEGRYDPLLFATHSNRHGLAFLFWQDPARWAGHPGLVIGELRNPSRRRVATGLFGALDEIGTFTATREAFGKRIPAQSWKIFRGRLLAIDPAAWIHLRPEGRYVVPR
jgi:4-amino-4-deoxy-L-arabinose transferase-like glycosyltransferase